MLGSALVALTLAAAASAEPGGAAICWGLGNAGQLGDGRSGDTAGGHFSPVPVQVLAPAGGVALQFDTLSAGGMHVCGLAAGRPFCWVSSPRRLRAPRITSHRQTHWTSFCTSWLQGSNGYGQLGVPKYYSGMSAAPVPVTTDGLGGGAAPVPRIAAGSFHSCLLDAEGAAYCFGAPAVGLSCLACALSASTRPLCYRAPQVTTMEACWAPESLARIRMRPQAVLRLPPPPEC